MEDKIQIESWGCCQWYNDPPVYNKCPYLTEEYICNKYSVKLQTGEATDCWTGRDSFYVERCKQCISKK